MGISHLWAFCLTCKPNPSKNSEIASTKCRESTNHIISDKPDNWTSRWRRPKIMASLIRTGSQNQADDIWRAEWLNRWFGTGFH
jgi:hypothetical protein